MGVIKLSKSKKQIQFIADDGTVYIAATVFVKNLIDPEKGNQLVLLSKFPLKASLDRFKQSEVWNPRGLELDSDEVTRTNDSLSIKGRRDVEETEQFQDKKVW